MYPRHGPCAQLIHAVLNLLNMEFQQELKHFFFLLLALTSPVQYIFIPSGLLIQVYRDHKKYQCTTVVTEYDIQLTHFVTMCVYVHGRLSKQLSQTNILNHSNRRLHIIGRNDEIQQLQPFSDTPATVQIFYTAGSPSEFSICIYVDGKPSIWIKYKRVKQVLSQVLRIVPV